MFTAPQVNIFLCSQQQSTKTVGEYIHIDDLLECKLEPDPLAMGSKPTANKPSVVVRTNRPPEPIQANKPAVSMHNQVLGTLEASSFERERIQLLQAQTALLRTMHRSTAGYRNELLSYEREEQLKTQQHRQEILANRAEVRELKRRKLEFLMRKRAKPGDGDNGKLV